MKFLFFVSLVYSSILVAGNQVQEGTKTSMGPMYENGIYQESVPSPNEMNPSPNPAPASEAEMIDNSILRDGPIQAEEASPEDLKAEEEKQINQPNPNKIGN